MKRCSLLLALSATLLASACSAGSRPPRIGNAARDFTIQDADRQVSLNQFRGQVVVLNFWATWCPPCVQELPSMMTMQDRMRGKGVTALGVSIDVDGDAYHPAALTSRLPTLAALVPPRDVLGPTPLHPAPLDPRYPDQPVVPGATRGARVSASAPAAAGNCPSNLRIAPS